MQHTADTSFDSGWNADRPRTDSVGLLESSSLFDASGAPCDSADQSAQSDDAPAPELLLRHITDRLSSNEFKAPRPQPREHLPVSGAGSMTPVVAFTACPHCARPMSTGAIVCLSCGFNIVTGRLNPDALEPSSQARTSLRSWIGPAITAAIGIMAAVAVAILTWSTPASITALTIALAVVGLAWFSWAVVDARDTEGAQLKIWVVPGYVLAWVMLESRSRYLRSMTLVVLALLVTLAAAAFHLSRI